MPRALATNSSRWNTWLWDQVRLPSAAHSEAGNRARLQVSHHGGPGPPSAVGPRAGPFCPPPRRSPDSGPLAIRYFGGGNVQVIDEFRTTLVDYDSEKRLHRVNMRLHSGDKLREVRGVKLSRSSETNLMLTERSMRLVNRDLNAAKNIHKIAVSHRPKSMERGINIDANKSHQLLRRAHLPSLQRRQKSSRNGLVR